MGGGVGEVPPEIIYPRLSGLKGLFAVESDSSRFYRGSCPARERADDNHDNCAENHCLHDNHSACVVLYYFFVHKLSFKFLMATWVENTVSAGGRFGSESVVIVILTRRTFGMFIGKDNGAVVPS